MSGSVENDFWNPRQYERFRSERRQPFDELLAMIEPRPRMRIVDLGCGTGDLTRELHETLGAASTLGIDRSGRMLSRARGQTPLERLSFAQADLAEFTSPEPFDLVFSNAALQWTPDHPALLAGLTRLLADDGQLAVQVPASRGPIYSVAREVGAAEPFRTALGGWVLDDPVLRADEYASLLFKLGYERQRVLMRIYPHILASREEVVEWVKGTLLTSYQERMPASLFDAYLDAYRARLFQELADTRPFFFPFPRILFWGGRSR
jgi:trans-aconitate 2-methyltransferase